MRITFASAFALLYCLLFSSILNAQSPNPKLIRNGSFEVTNNCGGNTTNPFNPPGQPGQPDPPSCVSDWFATVGSPNLLTTFNNKGAFHGQNFTTCLASKKKFSTCNTEAFAQNLNIKLFKDQNYELSMFCRMDENSTPILPVSINLFGSAQNLSQIPSTSGLGPCPNPSDFSTLFFLSNFTQRNWTRISGTLTPNSDILGLMFFPLREGTTDSDVLLHFDSIIVKCTSKLNANFSYAEPALNTIQFTDLSNNPTNENITVSSWFWDFGDGTTSNLQNPIHVYAGSNSRNVCLTIQDNRGCTKTFCQDVDFATFCICDNGINIDAGNGSVLLSALNLPDDITTCLSIKGKLIVDKNVSLTNITGNNSVKMYAGSEIEINSGKTLTIRNSNINACRKMWKGIRILQGGFLDMESSTITDAVNALNAEAGAKINLKNNDFIANHVGVRITGNIVANAGGGTELTANRFTGGTLIANYEGQNPIVKNSLSGATITNCNVTKITFYKDWRNAIFKNLPIGISTSRSKVTVRATQFRNCGTAVSNNGSDLEAIYNDVVACNTGFLNLSCKNNTIKIQDNSNISANVGINVILPFNCTILIKNNILNAIRKMEQSPGQCVGILVSQNAKGTGTCDIKDNFVYFRSGDDFVGIKTSGFGKVYLYNNKVYGNEPAEDNKPMKTMEGISINASQSNTLFSNEVKGATVSFGDSYKVDGSSTWKMCSNTAFNNKKGFAFYSSSRSDGEMRKNIINASGIGVNIDASAIVGNQYVRVIGSQEAIGLSNEWNMNFSGTGIGFKADPFSTDKAVSFRVNSSANPTYLPAIVVAPTGLITNNANSNISQCYNIEGVIEEDHRDEVARKQITVPLYELTSMYNMQKELYESILFNNGNQVGTPSSVVDSFYQSNATTTLGKLALVSYQIQQYLASNTYNLATLQAIQHDNTNIACTNIWEQNEQSVNDIVLNRLAAENLEFTDLESIQLQSIANQCPRSNGLSVFQARMLYGLIDASLHFDDDVLCTYEGPSGPAYKVNPADTKIWSNVSIYPNPSTGHFVVNIPNAITDEALDLHIYAITGQLLYSQKVTGTQELNIEKLQSGLYICQLLQAGTMIHQQKLVIQQ